MTKKVCTKAISTMPRGVPHGRIPNLRELGTGNLLGAAAIGRLIMLKRELTRSRGQMDGKNGGFR